MRDLILWAALLLLVLPSGAQSPQLIDEALFQGMQWRNIGPFRGGRSVAVAGLPDNPLVYYMGTTGGGVWKTEDAGLNWFNISDGYFNTGSVGAIAIAPSDPNVVYVGMGEHPVRGVMTSHGDGVYRSLNGGKDWQYLGLPNSRHIAAIQVHPNDPDVVYVAVQGALYGPSLDRGVYYSNDGGQNWQQLLFVNETSGACDLSMDSNNPRILYAGMWDHQRTPWQIRSGGPGSGLYRSADGGLNWEKLINGLPEAMGKVGVCVSPANPERIYANIEAEEGGVFRSDDGGQNWVRVNQHRSTVARAWYYIEIIADPIDEETVYVLNAPLLRSSDGGKSFSSISNPHSDQHALWINPHKPDIMILGNDGGATITFNGGQSWSTQHNQPTGQFYRIITDNRFPYYIYSGQQDNSAIAIPSRTPKAGITAQDWYSVAGGESAFIAFDPDNPERIYGGSYQGELTVYDHHTGRKKDIMAYPGLSLSKLPREMKYRFNWNAPLVAQPQHPGILYHGANVVLRTEDGGMNWKEISPDLTRNEPEKQGKGGAPYTNEGAGGENYNTLSYLACSPLEAGTLWAGSDDGLLHLTRNEGQDWQNVTPPRLGEALINCIEASPHNPAAAYVVATKYRFNDLRPMAYYTQDFGKSWMEIAQGIDEEDFLRVIREDPVRPGLLYGGTETGLYISLNYGRNWQRFQLNLPACPINDLAVKGNSLVAATSGRAIWILDGLEPLQQQGDMANSSVQLFQPSPTVRFAGNTPEEPIAGLGQNPQDGALIYYYLPEDMDSSSFQLNILDAYGNLLRSYCNQADKDFQQYDGGPRPESLLPDKRGLNRFYWDLRREPLPGIPGVFILGSYEGSLAAPGEYTLQLKMNEQALERPLTVLPDPRLKACPRDYLEQQEVLVSIEQAVRDIHRSVQQMQEVKQQVENLHSSLKKIECTKELLDASQNIVNNIKDWEEKLVQPKQKTYQDVINFPNRLSAELLNLKQRVDAHDPVVTEGARQRLQELLSEWAQFRNQMRKIINEDIASFNRLYREYQMPAVILPLGAE
ncbi:MAG: glycosyl hydrolase [Lewinellaceae bacterium]|nr:glycosyl hydrolase [Phaeodactylibacter sp.]MCB0614314.1 glycosyl hydrolase [Phaeodactylibacter sp.]MCB9346578.1 glycosyl hydrolase [Lewinellaceae bacterium]